MELMIFTAGGAWKCIPQNSVGILGPFLRRREKCSAFRGSLCLLGSPGPAGRRGNKEEMEGEVPLIISTNETVTPRAVMLHSVCE